MKQINYIVMIVLLILIELFSLFYFLIYEQLQLYFNSPIIPIIILALIIIVAYFIYCKKNISINSKNVKIERLIIFAILLITIFKFLTLIPIFSLKSNIVNPMKEIDNNYKSYSSFEELRNVANVTDENFDETLTPLNIPYFGYINGIDYFKNFFLGSQIINNENYFNDSYSDFLKSIKKSNAIYGETWISNATTLIEEIQKNTLSLAIFSILYELLIIFIPIILRNKV